MNNQENDIVQKVETAATAVLASASKTPFKTAFMVTLGIGLAQIAIPILFFGTLTMFALILYAVFK
jgi:hypothetical protein